MNFKTTVVLIALLALIGGYMFFTREEAAKPTAALDPNSDKKLLDINAADVTKFVLTPAEGSPIALEKIDSNWRLTQPVSAAGENFQVDSLVRAITEARTRGTVNASGKDAETIGVSHPRYTIEITAGGKTTKLSVGNRSAVGDHMYVQLDGNKQADVIAANIAETLDQPASKYRKIKLIELSPTNVQNVAITSPAGKISLAKRNEDWEVTEPAKMPADTAAVTDLLTAVMNAHAVDFVSDDPGASANYGMTEPQAVIEILAAKQLARPSTQPTTAPAEPPMNLTLKIGKYDGVLQKNVYAMIDGQSYIMKIPAAVFDAVNKKPLELRDKRAANIDPSLVSKISLTSEQSGKVHQVVIERRKEAVALGPVLPTTTAATTQPAEPPSKWESKGDSTAKIDDDHVEAFLISLHPLSAEKYLETLPATLPSKRYELTITTQAPGETSPVEHRIAFLDTGTGGDGEGVIGTYNGLVFTTARSILSELEGGFADVPVRQAPPIHGQKHQPPRE